MAKRNNKYRGNQQRGGRVGKRDVSKMSTQQFLETATGAGSGRGSKGRSYNKKHGQGQNPNTKPKPKKHKLNDVGKRAKGGAVNDAAWKKVSEWEAGMDSFDPALYKNAALQAYGGGRAAVGIVSRFVNFLERHKFSRFSAWIAAVFIGLNSHEIMHNNVIVPEEARHRPMQQNGGRRQESASFNSVSVRRREGEVTAPDPDPVPRPVEGARDRSGGAQNVGGTKEPMRDAFDMTDRLARLELNGINVFRGGRRQAEMEALVRNAPAEVLQAIERASLRTGVPFLYMLSLAAIESGFNPRAVPPKGQARGLFQFVPDTWMSMMRRKGADYGIDVHAYSERALLDMRFDPEMSSYMAAELTLAHKPKLEKNGFYEPTATEFYMLHFAGEGRGMKFLERYDRTPDEIAAPHFPKSYRRNNPNVFYHGGKRSQPRTYEEIFDFFDEKFGVSAEMLRELERKGVSIDTFDVALGGSGYSFGAMARRDNAQRGHSVQTVDIG